MRFWRLRCCHVKEPGARSDNKTVRDISVWQEASPTLITLLAPSVFTVIHPLQHALVRSSSTSQVSNLQGIVSQPHKPRYLSRRGQ